MVTAMDISIASKFHLLLAQVHEGANFLDKALEDLLKARELQISYTFHSPFYTYTYQVL